VSGTLVIRFGALGDLCIASWFLAGLADSQSESSLTLVTKPAFADLAREIPGVSDVIALPGTGASGLIRLAAEIRQASPDIWLDAHGVLRSRLLGLLCRRRATARLHKDTIDRLRLIRRGAPTGNTAPKPGLALLDRLDAMVTGQPGRSRLIGEPRPPLAHLRRSSPPTRRIALAPGARWPTKRWPLHHLVAFTTDWLESHDGEFVILLGPDEQDWLDQPAARALAGRDRVQVITGATLVETAQELAQCRATVTNDSGLLHLSEAVGTPVVAMFGPTVRAFGYAPLLPHSRLLEVELECRPCSRTGSRPCHRGDLACLESIAPSAGIDALAAILHPDQQDRR